MWYVNTVESNNITIRHLGFILTMWYVNKPIIPNTIIIKLVLY